MVHHVVHNLFYYHSNGTQIFVHPYNLNSKVVMMFHSSSVTNLASKVLPQCDFVPINERFLLNVNYIVPSNCGVCNATSLCDYMHWIV